MKAFACGDVVPGCDARFVCSTDDDVLFAVAAHAATVHGIDDLSPALSRAVLAATVPAG
jgi:predicted small metal-binding protein